MALNTSASNNQLPRAYADLLQSIGAFIQYWGFKEVHGQVWTCIYLADDPVDANYIIQQLRLSKAAVSLAIKDLMEYNVILEVQKTRPSTRRYISNPDLLNVILHVLRHREQQMLNMIVSSLRGLTDTSGEDLHKIRISRDKMSKLREMTECAQAMLDQVLCQGDVALSSLCGMMKCSENAENA